MNDLVGKAEGKKMQLEAREAALEMELVEVRTELAGWQSFIDRAKELEGDSEQSISSGTRGKSIPALATNVMRAHKGPMTLKDICSALERMVDNKSENFPVVVGQALRRRDDLFKSVKRGVFDLVDRNGG
jgi:hypothetical protein